MQSNLFVTCIICGCIYESGAVFELGLALLLRKSKEMLMLMSSKPKKNLRLALLTTLDIVFKLTCQTTLTQNKY